MTAPASGVGQLVFADPQVTADLRTYVTRARAADDGAIRLQADGQVLAGYVCVLRPRLLGEGTPTVLGLRTMPLSVPARTDVTVTLASLADRLARLDRDDVVLALPPVTVTESWTGIQPPRSGWEAVGVLPTARLEEAARAGIREVAQIMPVNPGALIVNNARGTVWGRPLAGLAAELPAGAAFAALTLGFLGAGDEAALYRNGRWMRLSTTTGHVLVRSAAVL